MKRVVEFGPTCIALLLFGCASAKPPSAETEVALAPSQHEAAPVSVRATREELVAKLLRTLPDDHPDLLLARLDLAQSLADDFDFAGARMLAEKALSVASRTLPPDHPLTLRARAELGRALFGLGDLEGARALQQNVLAARAKLLPDDHPDLQSARLELARSLALLGDLRGARELRERVLDALSRTLPPDHPLVLQARLDLAESICDSGDLAGARALQEQVLEALGRTRPDDDLELQHARMSLGETLASLGDLAGARALQEKALEVYLRKLPADAFALQRARASLAETIGWLGDLQGARALQELVLEVRTRTLPGDHPELQESRLALAASLFKLGDVAGARSLQEAAVQVLETTLPPDHPLVLKARMQLAATLRAMGQTRAASGQEGAVVQVLSVTLPQDHPQLQQARSRLAWTLASMGDDAGAREQASQLAASLRTTPQLPRSVSPREAEERAVAGQREISTVLSLGAGGKSVSLDAALNSQAFASLEATRSAGLLAARSQQANRAGEWMPGPSADALSQKLVPGDELVTYSAYTRIEIDPATSSRRSSENFLAFVVSPDGALERVDLGSVEQITNAAERWRSQILAPDGDAKGERLAGEELRKLVFDPVRIAIGDAKRVFVVADGALHRVPLDALPLETGVVGDQLAVSTRLAGWELLLDEPAIDRPPSLLCVGGIDFGSRAPDSSVARGTDFVPLPESTAESRAIHALFTQSHDPASVATMLEGERASKEVIIELASRVRFLHIATHSWFAPESISSGSDAQLLDKQSGLGVRMSGADQVRAMSPMLLCGLAFAGANGPENELGRIPGLLTAEELARLDLSSCDLAVLSAGDTTAGVRRAGQGVASLQQALHRAGARSVITSLWRVSDEAANELMVDFYRRLWIEKKPKALALWEAKLKLRNAKDEQGQPRYSTRDWAAWVLTGDPR